MNQAAAEFQQRTPDKRDGLKVSNDPVVLDRLIRHEVLPCVGLPVVLAYRLHANRRVSSAFCRSENRARRSWFATFRNASACVG